MYDCHLMIHLLHKEEAVQMKVYAPIQLPDQNQNSEVRTDLNHTVTRTETTTAIQ